MHQTIKTYLENGISCYLNKCQTLSDTSHMTFFFLSGRHRIGALCMQQSNCCGDLDFLSPKPCPHTINSPELNALTTRLRESYSSVSMSRESKRLKKSRLHSGNTLIQHLSEKIRFSCFPVLSGSAEAHVICGGIVKCFLIAYFMGNISAKKYF